MLIVLNISCLFINSTSRIWSLNWWLFGNCTLEWLILKNFRFWLNFGEVWTLTMYWTFVRARTLYLRPFHVSHSICSLWLVLMCFSLTKTSFVACGQIINNRFGIYENSNMYFYFGEWLFSLSMFRGKPRWQNWRRNIHLWPD